MNKVAKIVAVCVFVTMFAQTGVWAELPKTPEELRNSDVGELSSRPQFDSRDYQIITPVKDQGNSSLCWAYSAINASEASLLRSGVCGEETANTLSLSPLQLGYVRHNRGSDPLGNTSGEYTGADWYADGGGGAYALTVLSQWCAPVRDGVPYDANGWENAAYLLEHAIVLDGTALRTSAQARQQIKRAIVRHGAVTFSYNNVREQFYYNPTREPGAESFPHACTIIGWDDTIPAEQFSPRGASQDGGWLVKNSYSSLGYFYLSYDCNSSNIFAFEYAPRDKYDYNYFYDSAAADFSLSLVQTANAANVFRAKMGTETGTEWLKAVNVGTLGENVSCQVQVYTDLEPNESGGVTNPEGGVKAAEESAFFEHAGYHTVQLSRPVELKRDSYYAVTVQVTNENKNAYITQSQNIGNSYVRGEYGWTKMRFTPRIKAFTKLERETSLHFTMDGAVEACVKEGGEQLLILARYQNGVLKELKVLPTVFQAGEKRSIPLPETWKNGDGTDVEAFLWNDRLAPLCEKAVR